MPCSDPRELTKEEKLQAEIDYLNDKIYYMEVRATMKEVRKVEEQWRLATREHHIALDRFTYLHSVYSDFLGYIQYKYPSYHSKLFKFFVSVYRQVPTKYDLSQSSEYYYPIFTLLPDVTIIQGLNDKLVRKMCIYLTKEPEEEVSQYPESVRSWWKEHKEHDKQRKRRKTK